jgi:hypothetical protein
MSMTRLRHPKPGKDDGVTTGVLVGTLGQAAKMAVMEGIPWTKVWGVMYLASFLVFELMVIARLPKSWS